MNCLYHQDSNTMMQCVFVPHKFAISAPLLHRPSVGGGAGIGGSVHTPPAEAPPQVKLGRVPKNARLIEAMAQHKNAKPKPKGWLMAVVDSIYKEGVLSGMKTAHSSL